MPGTVSIIQGIGCISVALSPPIATLPTQHCATFDRAAGHAVALAVGLGWQLVDETGRLNGDECELLVAAYLAGEFGDA